MYAPSANIHILKKFGASGGADTNTCSPEHLFAFDLQNDEHLFPEHMFCG
jgi:hypothetical protein